MRRTARLLVALVLGALPPGSGAAPVQAQARSVPGSGPIPFTFRWGPQRPDLVRYNRVEGFSVGARAQVRPDTRVGPLSTTLTARLGTADLHPDLRLDVVRETLRERLALSAYHELAAMEEGARHLGIANSLTALLFGRDEGDYYRRTGASLEWMPPSADPRTFRVRGWAEVHRAVGRETDFSLWHAARSEWVFRENAAARDGWEAGGEATLSPWWGSDPRAVQGGAEATVRAAGGDWRYAAVSAAGRVVLPFGGDVHLALGTGAGTSWGDPPAQRLFAVGGGRTLRGYAPRTLVGRSFGRARAELGRRTSFGVVSVFGDVGWAGERDVIRADEALASAGLALALVDGLIRVDAGWGLRAPRDFRLDLVLDGTR